jgi:hypothetical protein
MLREPACLTFCGSCFGAHGSSVCQCFQCRHDMSDSSFCILAFLERAYGPSTAGKSQKNSYSEAIRFDPRCAYRSDYSRFDLGRLRPSERQQDSGHGQRQHRPALQHFPRGTGLIFHRSGTPAESEIFPCRQIVATVATGRTLRCKFTPFPAGRMTQAQITGPQPPRPIFAIERSCNPLRRSPRSPTSCGAATYPQAAAIVSSGSRRPRGVSLRHFGRPAGRCRSS